MVDTIETDGRKAKRVANREAAVRALIDLWREGVYFAKTEEIAARAGLSGRSLFRYFADADELVEAAMRSFRERAGPLMAVDFDLGEPLELRVSRLVSARFRSYDVIGPGFRAALVHAPRSARFAARTSRQRAWWREQAREVLADRLSGSARRLGPAVDVLLSFEAYELLRRDEGLSRRAAESVTVRAICAVLA